MRCIPPSIDCRDRLFFNNREHEDRHFVATKVVHSTNASAFARAAGGKSKLPRSAGPDHYVARLGVRGDDSNDRRYLLSG